MGRNCGSFVCGASFWDNLSGMFVSNACAVAVAFIWNEAAFGTLVSLWKRSPEYVYERPGADTVKTVPDAAVRLGLSFGAFIFIWMVSSLLAAYSEGRLKSSLRQLLDIVRKADEAKEALKNGPTDEILEEGDDKVSWIKRALLPKSPHKILSKSNRRTFTLLLWRMMAEGIAVVPAFGFTGVVVNLLLLCKIGITAVTSIATLRVLTFAAVNIIMTFVAAALSILLTAISRGWLFAPDEDPTLPPKKRFVDTPFGRQAVTQVKVAMGIGVGFAWDLLIRRVVVEPWDAKWVVFLYAPLITVLAPVIYWKFLDEEEPVVERKRDQLIYSFKMFLGTALGTIIGMAWIDCWEYIRDMWGANKAGMEILRNFTFAMVLTAIGTVVVVGMSQWQSWQVRKAEAGEKDEGAEEGSAQGAALMERSTSRVIDLLLLAIGIVVGWAWEELCGATFETVVGHHSPQFFRWLPVIILWLYTILTTELFAVMGVFVVYVATYAKGGDLMDTLLGVAPLDDKTPEEMLESARSIAQSMSSVILERGGSGVVRQMSGQLLSELEAVAAEEADR